MIDFFGVSHIFKMRHLSKLLLVAVAVVTPFFLNPQISLAITAEEATKLLQPAAREAGFETRDVAFASTIGNLIAAVLGFLGVLALVVVIYAGYLWTTAAGNEEQVTKAKDWLRNGVIGLIIISLAFALTQFVIRAIIGEEVRREELVTPGEVGLPGFTPPPPLLEPPRELNFFERARRFFGFTPTPFD